MEGTTTGPGVGATAQVHRRFRAARPLSARQSTSCWLIFARNWWLVKIHGVSAILFGLNFLWPNLTLVVLITLFA